MNAIAIQKKDYKINNSRIGKKPSSFFGPSTLQKKLSIGASNDAYEVEADRVADQVVAMSDVQVQKQSNNPLVQRKCSACEEEHVQKKSLADGITPFIQKKESNSNDGGVASDNITSRINSSKGSGRAMDNNTKSFMENRFGADFSNVRLHTGTNAIQLSQQLNAQAFTVGNDIYFNKGKYNATSTSGKHLLAHELTHTVQQEGAVQMKIQKSSGSSDSSGDEEGDEAAPPSGDCKVDVRATRISGLGGLPVYHLFVILKNKSTNSEYFYRGGPSSRGSSYGNIKTTHGKYKSGTIDWAPSAPSITVNDPVDCNVTHGCLVGELSRIDRTATPYSPTGPNSNSVVRTILRNCSLTEAKPVYIAPGWDDII